MSWSKCTYTGTLCGYGKIGQAPLGLHVRPQETHLLKSVKGNHSVCRKIYKLKFYIYFCENNVPLYAETHLVGSRGLLGQLSSDLYKH